MSQDKNLQGLGGWLTLVGLGIIVSPLIIIAQLYGFSNIFENGTWAALTTPGTEAYNPMWKLIIFGELAINIVVILAWLFIAYLFFGKFRAFPNWYIGILISTTVLMLIDALIVKSVLPEMPIFDAESGKDFAQSIVVTIIWVPYMMYSKRVKATFVN